MLSLFSVYPQGCHRNPRNWGALPSPRAAVSVMLSFLGFGRSMFPARRQSERCPWAQLQIPSLGGVNWHWAAAVHTWSGWNESEGFTARSFLTRSFCSLYFSFSFHSSATSSWSLLLLVTASFAADALALSECQKPPRTLSDGFSGGDTIIAWAQGRLKYLELTLG